MMQFVSFRDMSIHTYHVFYMVAMDFNVIMEVTENGQWYSAEGALERRKIGDLRKLSSQEVYRLGMYTRFATAIEAIYNETINYGILIEGP